MLLDIGQIVSYKEVQGGGGKGGGNQTSVIRYNWNLADFQLGQSLPHLNKQRSENRFTPQLANIVICGTVKKIYELGYPA